MARPKFPGLKKSETSLRRVAKPRRSAPKFMSPRAPRAQVAKTMDVTAIRKAVMPDLSKATRAPKWLEWFGLAARRNRRLK
jgi:hypothetical protein